MDKIVEQIAREVMQKLKTGGANRGSSYTPVSARDPRSKKLSGVTGVLLTANFKVINPILGQIRSIVPHDGMLIVSGYLYDNYRDKLTGTGMNLVHSGILPPHKVIENIRELIVPSLSISTLSKAANLVSDTYASQILSFAVCEGIPVTVTDDSLIDSSRYFPAGVSKKIEAFKNDLQAMSVSFTRGNVHIVPEHKCSPCSSANCAACTTCNTSTTEIPTREPSMASKSHCDAAPDSCPRSYGSCLSNCESKVQKIVEAGADRLDKGLEAPIPSRDMARYIDHTLLKPNATVQEITALCEEAAKYTFASVCVNPSHVGLSAKLLQGTPVKVCTVVGFPLGATSTFSKVMETRDAIANGAGEIDMVVNVGALKSKDYELVKNDIARVVEAANGKIVKVILETALLDDEEKAKACELSKLAGADFVKTSTGFSSGGATVKDICLMRCIVGPQMGVKASGGIRDYKTALEMIQAGATRIGASASVGIVKGDAPTQGKSY